MSERGVPRWIAAAAVVVVALVMIDVVRRAVPAGGEDAVPLDTAPPITVVRPTVPVPVSQGGTADAPPPRSNYIEQLARAEMRRRIRASAGIAYLHAIQSAGGDSMLHRWDGRSVIPVRVHLAPDTVTNFQPAFLESVRQAFLRWQTAGVPVRFDLGSDSARAEVHVRWLARFDIERSGQTDLTWNQDGQVLSGVMTIATHDPTGRAMGPEDVRIVTLHEIGHLIGLEHSPDSTDLMFPVAKVLDLSGRDVQTARLLYDLPPGSIR